MDRVTLWSPHMPEEPYLFLETSDLAQQVLAAVLSATLHATNSHYGVARRARLIKRVDESPEEARMLLTLLACCVAPSWSFRPVRQEGTELVDQFIWQRGAFAKLDAG